jgi:hypothetical protein
MKKATAKQVAALIEDTKGNVAVIAKRLGVNRSTVWNRCKETPTLMAALEQARESMKDNAESALYKAVLSGNITAMIFFLKTQGKDRGYVERQEVTVADMAAVDEWLEAMKGHE